MNKLMSGNNYFLFETNKVSKSNYRSFYFFDPVKTLVLHNPDTIPDFFRELEELKKQYYCAGFFSYELGYYLDDAFQKKRINHHTLKDFPYAYFCAYENPVILDHREDKSNQKKNNLPFDEPVGPYSIDDLKLSIPEHEYHENIKKIRDHIIQGDIYQANYTMKYTFDFSGSPWSLYHDLKKKQHVSYNVFARFNDTCLISLTPELFFRKSGNVIEVKPMKGTMKRGRTRKEDKANRDFLQNDKKNRSENVMIVDLLRNDIGKISSGGSVRVMRLYEIEKYDTLFQMTSTVESVIEDDITVLELVKGIFPSGSVTGAPKIRSMEIINELEHEERKVYTGSIGFFEPSGDAVFNVAIRTILIQDGRGEMGIGGGIVYDSTPESEFLEAQLKGKFLTGKSENDFSLIETILFDGDFNNLDFHLERLRESAEYFDYPFDENRYRSKLQSVRSSLGCGRYRVRTLLSESGVITVEYYKADAVPEVFTITFSEHRTDSTSPFYFHKTTNRDLYNCELKKARKKGFFDCIFTNERGEITEGAVTNIYIKKDGKIITPPIECGLLDGTVRRSLTRKNRVFEKKIFQEDLDGAEEIYISNAIIGFQKVDSFQRF